MQARTRRATAIGAAAFALAGSAALALPGSASAATTITTPCGSTVSAKPGDTVVGTTSLLGLPINVNFGMIGQVTATLSKTVNGLLDDLCNVTVNVVNTVVAPVPVVGAPAASAVNGAVAGTTHALENGAKALSGQPAQQNPPAGGSPQAPPAGGSPAGTTPVGGQAPGSPTIPGPNSPVLGGGSMGFGSLPLDFSTGYAPMRDYSTIPMAMAGVYAPSPGLRYGGQIPGYAPEFGLPGDTSTKQDSSGVQNAGQAEALPGGDGVTPGVGLPVLIAVLSLSGVSAGLVRTWVLRRTAASA